MVGGANTLSEMCHVPPGTTNTNTDYLVVITKVLVWEVFGTRVEYL